MKIKKIILLILTIVILATMTIGLIIVIRHSQIAYLCQLIESGQTEFASKKIQELSDVNMYSVPLSIQPIYNIIDEDVKLPLVTACDVGDAELVKLLLEKGADPNLFLKDNWTPIEVLFERGHKNRLEIAKLLVQNGANVDLYASYHTALFCELSKYMRTVDNSSKEEREYSIRCIRYLLENGANPRNNEKNTIIHYFAASGDVESLSVFSVDFKEFISQTNIYGETPLIWATRKARRECIIFLIDNGAAINTMDHNGKTALDYAIESGNMEIIQLFQSRR